MKGKNKTLCEKCLKTVNTFAVRRYKSHFLCYNCWKQTQTIIGISEPKYIESLCKTLHIHTTLTITQDKLLKKRLTQLNMKKSDYVRSLIINDLDVNN